MTLSWIDSCCQGTVFLWTYFTDRIIRQVDFSHVFFYSSESKLHLTTDILAYPRMYIYIYIYIYISSYPYLEWPLRFRTTKRLWFWFPPVQIRLELIIPSRSLTLQAIHGSRSRPIHLQFILVLRTGLHLGNEIISCIPGIDIVIVGSCDYLVKHVSIFIFLVNYGECGKSLDVCMYGLYIKAYFEKVHLCVQN